MAMSHPTLASIRSAMEHHPHTFLDAGEISVATHARTVTLRGVVHAQEQRDMAEHDAWYVFGVDKVENHLTVIAR